MSASNPAAPASPVRSLLARINLQQYVVYVGFLAIFLFFAVVLRDSGFLTQRNLVNIILQTAPATIMAIGLVFVLSAGEIDLSFGSTVAVSALCAAMAMAAMPMAAFPIGILAGLGAGLPGGVEVVGIGGADGPAPDNERALGWADRAPVAGHAAA